MLNLDKLICNVDRALRVITGTTTSSRPVPNLPLSGALDSSQRRHSAGLMRINHVGEVCAQALYDAQGHFAQREELRHRFALAAREEEDHLAWTAERLQELGARPSLLNPVWYAGAYLLGAVAAKSGDAQSLGFVVETERQVEAHLAKHLVDLPPEDSKSRAIVEQMRLDEIAHGDAAQELGAKDLPAPIRQAMRAMAKVMTSTAYYI